MSLIFELNRIPAKANVFQTMDPFNVHARIAFGICTTVMGWTVRSARSDG